MSTHYQLLGVPMDANLAQIKKAYRKLALELHPDKNNSDEALEMFKRVSDGYQVLSDAELRREYDKSLQKTTVNVNPFNSTSMFYHNFTQARNQRQNGNPASAYYDPYERYFQRNNPTPDFPFARKTRSSTQADNDNPSSNKENIRKSKHSEQAKPFSQRTPPSEEPEIIDLSVDEDAHNINTEQPEHRSTTPESKKPKVSNNVKQEPFTRPNNTNNESTEESERTRRSKEPGDTTPRRKSTHNLYQGTKDDPIYVETKQQQPQEFTFSDILNVFKSSLHNDTSSSTKTPLSSPMGKNYSKRPTRVSHERAKTPGSKISRTQLEEEISFEHPKHSSKTSKFDKFDMNTLNAELNSNDTSMRSDFESNEDFSHMQMDDLDEKLEEIEVPSPKRKANKPKQFGNLDLLDLHASPRIFDFQCPDPVHIPKRHQNIYSIDEWTLVEKQIQDYLQKFASWTSIMLQYKHERTIANLEHFDKIADNPHNSAVFQDAMQRDLEMEKIWLKGQAENTKFVKEYNQIKSDLKIRHI
ncbi:BA75_01947T0 [Komagataella pastoris]|uniref:BA75_01947T0 n=1 Tax=Komagataella pastoris TaxID=4922 RepID=A0A1B2JC62_PICPA|nr:BA75_01947T0 [Komagataella pastoris]